MERLKLKVAVFMLFLRGNEILLSSRLNTGWQDGNYGLPSGHLESGETAVEALLRETKEETGIELKSEDVEFVHVMHYKSIYINFLFKANHWTGEPKIIEKDRCDDMQWFPLNNLPANVIPSVKFAIENYQKGILFSEFLVEE